MLPAVANVTTAVDIYSFGMCALEVRVDLILLLAVGLTITNKPTNSVNKLEGIVCLKGNFLF